jgi:hypothetical protein
MFFDLFLVGVEWKRKRTAPDAYEGFGGLGLAGLVVGFVVVGREVPGFVGLGFGVLAMSSSLGASICTVIDVGIRFRGVDNFFAKRMRAEKMFRCPLSIRASLCSIRKRR